MSGDEKKEIIEAAKDLVLAMINNNHFGNDDRYSLGRICNAFEKIYESLDETTNKNSN